MHGVSAVIVVIMLLMISVSLAGLAYTFATAMVTETTETGSEMIEQTTSSMLAQMTIESIGDNNVYIRNTGQTDLSSFSVYVNDKSVDISAPSSIPPGQLDSISIHSIINKDDIIKVTSARGTSAIKSVPDPCKSSSVVICLRFDESSGTTASDSSGYRNDGTLVNMEPTDWVSGKYGNALQFDGTNEYVLTELNGVFEQEMTLSVWFSISDWGSRAVMGRYHYTSVDQGWMLYRNSHWANGQVGWIFRYRDTSDNSGYILPMYNNLDQNRWYHAIAVIYPDGSYKTFLNDTLYTEGTVSNFVSWGGNNMNPNIKLTVGRGGETVGWYFNGMIDEVRIYNKAIY
jgi:FlaG/FlaF family flagellin (archaellin)